MTISFIACVVKSQTSVQTLTASIQNAPVSYEAANWKTRLLDDPQKITTPAPPNATQTKAELQVLRQEMSKLDDKKIADIKYWDAGAPSYRWNELETKLFDQNITRIDIIMRTPAAWMNVAIYDATVLAWKEKIRYKRKRPHDTYPSLNPLIRAPQTYSYPCEHTVTAAAAATVLAYFFPQQADSILQLAHDAARSRINAGVQFPSDTEAGWKLGEQVARQIIEKAKNDGSTRKFTGPVNTDHTKWTGPFAMGITLPLFTPMIIRSADQFRLPPPPSFDTEMKDLKNFKQTFRSRALAYYWASNGPQLWNDLVSQKMFEYHIADDAPAAARIYAALNTAYHDMSIAVFDSKYAYWGIWPNQLDSTFKPLLSTPPFPGYPSGHAAGAGTSCAVLEYFFPADAKLFHQMAQDCADSRFYAGIHFHTDNETALKMGDALGKYVAESWMEK